MQSLFEMTVGLERLKKIISEFPEDSSHWNEAQNRFHFIDRLLTECLGWEKPHIKVEDRDVLGGISDYHLGHPVKAVLEAKKESLLFEVPPLSSKKPVRKIAPLLAYSKNFKVCVEQVIGYCSIRGSQLGIVCNGPQMAIFQAIVIGESPLEGECFFFNGFNHYIDEFALLWELLSPEGVFENRAYRLIAQHRNPRIPQKGSSSISEPRKFKYRNEFQQNLQQLTSILLEEIEDNPLYSQDFYDECYVKTDANNRHLLLSKRLIKSRYSRVSENSSLSSDIDEISKIDKDGVFNIDTAYTGGSRSARPVVVIGDIGVGKSSFFKNLKQNLISSNDSETYLMYVNLGERATLSSTIKDYVLSELPRILRDNYSVDIDSAKFVQSIYHKDMGLFDNSIYGELKNSNPAEYEMAKIRFLEEKVSRRDEHLIASLSHLAYGRKKQIILILDNADQRSFEIQQEAFLIAQEMAASQTMIVFIALRPSTFYNSKQSGALAAYQNRILTISPPPADEVIHRRLSFALRVAEGKVAPQALEGVRVELGNVVSFLKATLRSVKQNQDIQQFLSNITGGNTRSVIELITGFFGSPNVNSKNIIEIELAGGNYIVPLHEFTKHALLGEYAYFNSQSSHVALNLFDVSTADPREHFLSSMIIAFLSASNLQIDRDGYISGQKIIDEMSLYGFVEDQVEFAIKNLAIKRLIETPHGHYREVPVLPTISSNDFSFRVTSIGAYHLRHWSGQFSYLDAVSIDTPIFDETARDCISRLSSSFNIADRYKKTISFKNYLDTQWDMANISCEYYDFSALAYAKRETFESVKKALDKGQNR